VLCNFFRVCKTVKIPWKMEKMPFGHTYISGTVCGVEELAGAVSKCRSGDVILVASTMKQLHLWLRVCQWYFDCIMLSTCGALLASLMRHLLVNPLKWREPFCFVGKHQTTFWTTLSSKVATLLIASDLVMNIFKCP